MRCNWGRSPHHALSLAFVCSSDKTDLVRSLVLGFQHNLERMQYQREHICYGADVFLSADWMAVTGLAKLKGPASNFPIARLAVVERKQVEQAQLPGASEQKQEGPADPSYRYELQFVHKDAWLKTALALAHTLEPRPQGVDEDCFGEGCDRILVHVDGAFFLRLFVGILF